MSKVIIRKGREEDLKKIEQIYNDFLDYEAEHGSKTNWIKGVYPTIENPKRGLKEDTLFVGELDGKIVGSYILNHVQPDEYKKLDWEVEAEGDEVLVIHTLCLDVNTQGKGLGRQFVDFAIEHARSLGCKVLRIDTGEHNEPAAKLYEKYGFRYVGKEFFLFEGNIPEHLICFEYKL